MGNNTADDDIHLGARYVFRPSQGTNHVNQIVPNYKYLVLWLIATFRATPDDDVVTKQITASTFLTVSTNIAVTALITFRLLRARRVGGRERWQTCYSRVYARDVNWDG